MLTTKIRTIIVLAAASAAASAVGPIAPVASAEYVRYHYQYCNDLHHALEEDVEKYVKSGGTDMEAFEAAELDVKLAEGAGCNWAGGEASRVKGLTSPTPAGTLHVSTPEGSTVFPMRPATSTPVVLHP